ncbi:MAG: hypothetical protein WBD87_01465 [Candidatus Acidiferrales bacterium]
MWTELLGALQSLLLSVSMLAITVLVGARPTLGSPQATVGGSGADTGLPPTETLRLQETTVFASTRPTAFRGGSHCDSEGDAFVEFARLVGNPLHVEPSSSISEVVPDGKRIVVYGGTQLSPSDYPNSRLTDFSVLPNGVLYALIFTRRDAPSQGSRPEAQYYIERFKDDGTMDSITAIHAPPGIAHWYADLLGAFPDGNFLIVGTSTASAGEPSASSWRPFTAIYDPTGRFVAEVTLPDDVANDSNKSGSGLPRSAGGKASKPQQYFEVAITTGGVVNGPDGNVWILRASDPLRLYAVNSSGLVTQHFKVSPPAPELEPSGFGFANSAQIFFNFGHFGGGSSSDLVGLFSAFSGRFDALYSLPDTEKGFRTLACSDGNGGFFYLGSTPDNHLAVFDYASR